jgi:hypothetical protein
MILPKIGPKIKETNRSLWRCLSTSKPGWWWTISLGVWRRSETKTPRSAPFWLKRFHLRSIWQSYPRRSSIPSAVTSQTPWRLRPRVWGKNSPKQVRYWINSLGLWMCTLNKLTPSSTWRRNRKSSPRSSIPSRPYILCAKPIRSKWECTFNKLLRKCNIYTSKILISYSYLCRNLPKL